ncbi:MAG: 2'-5' RNA ligase family protein [Anaerolineales bacterium]|nr:2'-5' RNA ligase family protein [Anaerolineales bacterium]
MKAAFALLADHITHNQIRKLSWNIHRKYHTGIDICRLPPHISLKQPFNISKLDLLEEYMSEFVNSISPFEINLTGLELIKTTMDGSDTGILWMNVEETKTLRQLHSQLHEELTSRFGDVSAPFDGLEYHFHMTVAIGGQPFDTYQNIYSEFSSPLKNIHYIAREIGLFVYDESDEINVGYITYKILPLADSRN